MTPALPPSVARYFAGKNARDFAAAAAEFAPGAVVRDEGGRHEGQAEIAAWMAETAARYDDRSELRSAAREGDRVAVVAEVSGTFPGSTAAIRFVFTLDGERIARLEIGA